MSPRSVSFSHTHRFQGLKRNPFNVEMMSNQLVFEQQDHMRHIEKRVRSKPSSMKFSSPDRILFYEYCTEPWFVNLYHPDFTLTRNKKLEFDCVRMAKSYAYLYSSKQTHLVAPDLSYSVGMPIPKQLVTLFRIAECNDNDSSNGGFGPGTGHMRYDQQRQHENKGGEDKNIETEDTSKQPRSTHIIENVVKDEHIKGNTHTNSNKQIYGVEGNTKQMKDRNETATSVDYFIDRKGCSTTSLPSSESSTVLDPIPPVSQLSSPHVAQEQGNTTSTRDARAGIEEGEISADMTSQTCENINGTLNKSHPSSSSSRRNKLPATPSFIRLPYIFGTEERMKKDVKQATELMRLFDKLRKTESSNPLTDEVLKDMPNNARRLDHITTYLRYVHSTCYYTCLESHEVDSILSVPIDLSKHYHDNKKREIEKSEDGNSDVIIRDLNDMMNLAGIDAGDPSFDLLETCCSGKPLSIVLRPKVNRKRKLSEEDLALSRRLDSRLPFLLRRDYDRLPSGSSHAEYEKYSGILKWSASITRKPSTTTSIYHCALAPVTKKFYNRDQVRIYLRNHQWGHYKKVLATTGTRIYLENFKADARREKWIALYTADRKEEKKQMKSSVLFGNGTVYSKVDSVSNPDRKGRGGNENNATSSARNPKAENSHQSSRTRSFSNQGPTFNVAPKTPQQQQQQQGYQYRGKTEDVHQSRWNGNTTQIETGRNTKPQARRRDTDKERNHHVEVATSLYKGPSPYNSNDNSTYNRPDDRHDMPSSPDHTRFRNDARPREVTRDNFNTWRSERNHEQYELDRPSRAHREDVRYDERDARNGERDPDNLRIYRHQVDTGRDLNGKEPDDTYKPSNRPSLSYDVDRRRNDFDNDPRPSFDRDQRRSFDYDVVKRGREGYEAEPAHASLPRHRDRNILYDRENDKKPAQEQRNRNHHRLDSCFNDDYDRRDWNCERSPDRERDREHDRDFRDRERDYRERDCDFRERDRDFRERDRDFRDRDRDMDRFRNENYDHESSPDRGRGHSERSQDRDFGRINRRGKREFGSETSDRWSREEDDRVWKRARTDDYHRRPYQQ